MSLWFALARRVMLPVALAALAVTPAAAQRDAPTMGRSVTVLAKVPLKSRNGAPVLFGSRVAQGKPTLVAFWASWCMPCYAEAPYLNKIRKEAGGGLNFLYIQRREGEPDPDQPPATIARFLNYGGMADVDYLVADVAAYRRILGADMSRIPAGLVGIPRVYLFDRKGRQIYTSYGFQDSDGAALAQLVKRTVAGR